MKSNELRIGNYVEHYQRGITDIRMLSSIIDLVSFKPIPLTEEWLVNFGFKKEYNTDEDGFSWYLTDCCDSFYVNSDDNYFYLGATTYGYLKEVQYVHQLQNIYFVLTNEELIIK